MAAPKQSNDRWLWPPPDQWLTVWGGFVLLVLVVVANQFLNFFSIFGGVFAGLTVATFGASLIFYAKLPLYRQLRFFTFGPRAIPPQRSTAYRLGIGLAIFGIVLTLVFAMV